MGRRLDQTVAATHGALVEGEQVAASGFCWAAQLGDGPLLFLGRRRYLMILTNRRLLMFNRRGRQTSRPGALVIGKRYEWFKLGRVRRARPLLQILLTAGNESRMIFEFPPRYRELGQTLLTRLEGDRTPPGPTPTSTADPDPAAAPGPAPPPAPVPAVAANPGDRSRTDESVFWGPSTPTS